MIRDRDTHFYESPDSRVFFGKTWKELFNEKVGKEIEDLIFEDGQNITNQSLGYCTVTDKHKEVFFDEGMNLFYSQPCYYKNHHMAELKMSVRIAKNNLSFDISNKYYQEQLKLAENYLKIYFEQTT